MKLHIERRYVESLIEAFPNRRALQEQLRFGNKVEVAYQQLSAAEWGFLQAQYATAGASMQTQAALLAALHNTLQDTGERYAAEDLEKLLPSMAAYLLDNALRGWLFHADSLGRTSAYLITRLDFNPPGEEEAGRMLIELKANAKGKIAIETLVLRAKDIAAKTIPEMLLAKGFLKETPRINGQLRRSGGALF